MMDRQRTILLVLLTLLVLTWARPAASRTWRVEKDGSADFSVIQDAVDVAASGDTVLIGTGRFDTMHWVTTTGWSDSLIVHVSVYELTLRGSGPGTVIGTVEMWDDPLAGRRKGIVGSDWWGNHVLRVENLRIEHMRDGIFTSYEFSQGDTLLVKDCEFYGNHNAIGAICHDGLTRITGSTFDHMSRGGNHIVGFNQALLEIKSCQFSLWDYNPLALQRHLALQDVQRARVTDCEFRDGFTGAVSSGSADVVFDRCHFYSQRGFGLYVSLLTNVEVLNSRFEDQRFAITTHQSDNSIQIRGTSFSGITDCALEVRYTGSLSVSGCDLSGGERGVIWCGERQDCVEIQTLEMTDNYWGTTDPDSIDGLIRDLNDIDNTCFYVDYEPFLLESTPVEATSLSDLKSMFR